jgi:hypothetical protein
MQICRELTDIEIKVSLNDDNGIFLDPISVSFSLLDSNSNIVAPTTALSTFLAGDTEALVNIVPAHNSIGFELDGITQKKKDYKTLILTLTLYSGAMFVIETQYIVSKSSQLSIMENTYQLMVFAEMLSMDMKVPDWKIATSEEKRLAMIEAYTRLGKFGYEIQNNLNIDSQSLLYANLFISPVKRRIHHLNFMKAEAFLDLPSNFLDVIRRAQLIEADAIIHNDISPSVVRSRMIEGVRSETIGDSSITMKTTIGAEYTISKATMRELSGYLCNYGSIGRS